MRYKIEILKMGKDKYIDVPEGCIPIKYDCSLERRYPVFSLVRTLTILRPIDDKEYIEDKKIEDEKIEKGKIEDKKIEKGKIEDKKIEKGKIEDKKIEKGKIEDKKIEKGKIEDKKIEEIKEEKCFFCEDDFTRDRIGTIPICAICLSKLYELARESHKSFEC